jgi:hypothetical protein
MVKRRRARRKGGDLIQHVRNAAYSGTKWAAAQLAQRLVSHPTAKAALGLLTPAAIDILVGHHPEIAAAERKKRKRRK